MSGEYGMCEQICHWCGKGFKTGRGRLTVRFCGSRCKMAHHRAFKKYVTAVRSRTSGFRRRRVTGKK